MSIKTVAPFRPSLFSFLYERGLSLGKTLSVNVTHKSNSPFQSLSRSLLCSAASSVRLMEESTRKKCVKVRYYILIAVVYLLMEETVLTESTFTSLSVPPPLGKCCFLCSTREAADRNHPERKKSRRQMAVVSSIVRWDVH